MKYNPYLGEWIVLPDGATISDEALSKAAQIYIGDHVFTVCCDRSMPANVIKMVDSHGRTLSTTIAETH